MDKAALEAAEVAWRASIHPTCKGMLTAAIEAYLASLPSPGEAEPVAWTNREALEVTALRGADTPYEQPMWSEPTPEHDVALFAAPPSERKAIEALKGLLVYTFEDDPGTLILSYDGTALARIDLDTEPGSALLKLEQELAALRASGGTP